MIGTFHSHPHSGSPYPSARDFITTNAGKIEIIVSLSGTRDKKWWKWNAANKFLEGCIGSVHYCIGAYAFDGTGLVLETLPIKIATQ